MKALLKKHGLDEHLTEDEKNLTMPQRDSMRAFFKEMRTELNKTAQAAGQPAKKLNIDSDKDKFLILMGYTEDIGTKLMIETRMKTDFSVARLIDPSRKALIVNGAAHLIRPEGDLDSSVGENNSITLRVYHNRPEYLKYANAISLVQKTFMNGAEGDLPDFILELSTGRLKLQNGSESVLPIPKALRKRTEDIFRDPVPHSKSQPNPKIEGLRGDRLHETPLPQ